MTDCMDFDTLRHDEQHFLRRTAAEDCPTHRFLVQTSQDGLEWVVLEPPSVRAGYLRFTICKIEPSVLVLVEDHDSRRQICSTSCVEDAMAFVRTAADQAILAAMNAHPAHPVRQ